MTSTDPSPSPPSLLAAKALFTCECALALWAALALVVFTRNHASFFAFPVEPAMTAAFLGANFAAGGAMKLAALGERRWLDVRQSVPGALVYEATVGAVTAQHLDQFNLSHPPALVWIAAYLILPFASLWVLFRYQRRPAPPRATGPPLPSWVRVSAGTAGFLVLGAAAALLAAPAQAVNAWPWRLIPDGGPYAGTDGMTGYVGAWLLGIGATLAQVARENDARRSRCVFIGGVVLGLGNLFALARFAPDIRWANPAAWALLTVLVMLLGASAAGLQAGRRGALPRPVPA